VGGENVISTGFRRDHVVYKPQTEPGRTSLEDKVRFLQRFMRRNAAQRQRPAGGTRSSRFTCFRGCPLSHTLRPTFSPIPATPGSGATFYFPQNSFVWENKKIDSRPYNGHTSPHALLPQPPPTPKTATAGRAPGAAYPVPTPMTLNAFKRVPALERRRRQGRSGRAQAAAGPTLHLP
jgi:hypothetical protein